MLNATIAPAPFGSYRRLCDLGQFPFRAKRGALFEDAMQARLLARYVEGWAEANLVKIADATAPGYGFDGCAHLDALLGGDAPFIPALPP
jgi:hypothetical protein